MFEGERCRKMYDELASWWPLLSPAAEYEEEAAFYARMLADACDGPLRTVLELGSGVGSNASHLVWDTDPSDTTYVVDYVYLLRTADGSVRVEHDRHIEGLFTPVQWIRFLSDAGFHARSIPLEHSELEPGAHEVFVVTKPAAGQNEPRLAERQKE